MGWDYWCFVRAASVCSYWPEKSTLKNQIHGTVFIYKVTNVKVRKISEHCDLSRIFYFLQGRERGSAVSKCYTWRFFS